MTSSAKRKGSERSSRSCACGCGERTSLLSVEYVRGHRPPISLAEALSRGFTPSSHGCWEWQRYIRPHGYGQLGIPGTRRTIDAHRASWIIHRGPIPPGVFVCHRCDNRRCVRPDHLFLGTHADNMRDMWSKGRGARTHGVASGNGRLTSAQVAEIRRRHVPGVHPARRSGSSSTELAREFGVTRQYIGQLVAGKWRAVA